MSQEKPLVFLSPLSESLKNFREHIGEHSEAYQVEALDFDDINHLDRVLESLGPSVILTSSPKKAAQTLRHNRKVLAHFHSKIMVVSPKQLPRKVMVKMDKLGLNNLIIEPVPAKQLQYKISLLLKSIDFRSDGIQDEDKRFDHDEQTSDENYQYQKKNKKNERNSEDQFKEEETEELIKRDPEEKEVHPEECNADLEAPESTYDPLRSQEEAKAPPVQQEFEQGPPPPKSEDDPLDDLDISNLYDQIKHDRDWQQEQEKKQEDEKAQHTSTAQDDSPAKEQNRRSSYNESPLEDLKGQSSTDKLNKNLEGKQDSNGGPIKTHYDGELKQDQKNDSKDDQPKIATNEAIDGKLKGRGEYQEQTSSQEDDLNKKDDTIANKKESPQSEYRDPKLDGHYKGKQEGQNNSNPDDNDHQSSTDNIDAHLRGKSKDSEEGLFENETEAQNDLLPQEELELLQKSIKDDFAGQKDKEFEEELLNHVSKELPTEELTQESEQDLGQHHKQEEDHQGQKEVEQTRRADTETEHDGQEKAKKEEALYNPPKKMDQKIDQEPSSENESEDEDEDEIETGQDNTLDFNDGTEKGAENERESERDKENDFTPKPKHQHAKGGLPASKQEQDEHPQLNEKQRSVQDHAEAQAPQAAQAAQDSQEHQSADQQSNKEKSSDKIQSNRKKGPLAPDDSDAVSENAPGSKEKARPHPYYEFAESEKGAPSPSYTLDYTELKKEFGLCESSEEDQLTEQSLIDTENDTQVIFRPKLENIDQLILLSNEFFESAKDIDQYGREIFFNKLYQQLKKLYGAQAMVVYNVDEKNVGKEHAYYVETHDLKGMTWNDIRSQHSKEWVSTSQEYWSIGRDNASTFFVIPFVKDHHNMGRIALSFSRLLNSAQKMEVQLLCRCAHGIFLSWPKSALEADKKEEKESPRVLKSFSRMIKAKVSA